MKTHTRRTQNRRVRFRIVRKSADDLKAIASNVANQAKHEQQRKQNSEQCRNWCMNNFIDLQRVNERWYRFDCYGIASEGGRERRSEKETNQIRIGFFSSVRQHDGDDLALKSIHFTSFVILFVNSKPALYILQRLLVAIAFVLFGCIAHESDGEINCRLFIISIQS